MAQPKRDSGATPLGPPRTPLAARQLADYHESSAHELGARRGRYLRKWAHATGQARSRARSGMSADAEAAWMKAEGHRQELADMGVEVPTRTELEAPPAPNATRAGGASSAGRPTGLGRPSPSRKGAPRSARSLAKGASDASGVSGLAASGWSVASAVFVGSVALILLMRLVDTKKGGPQVVQFAASGVARVVDLVVNPVDPFASGSKASKPVAAPAGPSGPVGNPSPSSPIAPAGPVGPVSP